MHPQIYKDLKAIVGSHNVLDTIEERTTYSYDVTFKSYLPDVVVIPTKTEQVAAIIKLANRERIPVYPRGAATGLSGGSLPVLGGIAMSLVKMNRILEIDSNNMVAVVEAGAITGNIHLEVEKEGLFYPPDPASSSTCTIGGNIAECAGGPRGLKYGVTKDYVLGLEVVTPTGEIITTGGKTLKNVTGYDLTRLMIGSEGTLGVITKAFLRLIPKPKAVKTLLAVFDDLNKAGEAIVAIPKSGATPATLEIMDALTIACAEKYAPSGLPLDAEAVLLIEVDGNQSVVNEEAEIIAQICTKLEARSVVIANSEEERQKLWRARKSVSSAIVKIKPTKISEDATVPRAQVPDMIKGLQEIRDKYKLNLFIYGHAGDGNLHPNIIADQRDPEEMERVEKAIKEIFEVALSLGGTLSGEHGIGIMKSPFIMQEVGKDSLEYMKKIKASLDPNGILNPGKIFPTDN